MMDKTAALMRKIGYEFSDPERLTLALTHRSKSANNYERLEFLGDSILGFVVADWLYREYPTLAEGKLSRMRASLVRKETLAEVARSLDLSDYLILGEGELKSGGFNRDSILSDTVESIIGALYLDADFACASDFIYRMFEPHFTAISEHTNFKDAKSRLQEHMQKRGLELPIYKVIDVFGHQHEQQFTLECRLVDLSISAQATAGSRRLAEQKSAEDVLQQLASAENKKK